MSEVMRRRAARQLFRLAPDYRERIWGGDRLRSARPPIGEAWIAFDGSRIAAGPDSGRTVGELTAELGAALLGRDVEARVGRRFPLLLKLLDCAGWLSVQVHPTDEQARRLVGPDEFGKTEAWYFIETEPGARILAGAKPGTAAAELAAAIRGGRVRDVIAEVSVHDGEAVLVPAGMLHALGPGLLLYEIQQASDTTYRVYDWDRPLTAGRRLHIEESAECAVPYPPARPSSPALPAGDGSAAVVSCPYFELELVRATAAGFRDDTRGRSFHALTVLTGEAEVRCGEEGARLGRFETVLVAGEAGGYEIGALTDEATLLLARVPDQPSNASA